MGKGRFKLRRAISIALSAALLVQGFPIVASADSVSSGSNQTTNAAVSTNTQHKIIAEVDEKRQANIKQFKLDDGSFMAVEYPSDVHYMQNGKWKDIDNSLTTFSAASDPAATDSHASSDTQNAAGSNNDSSAASNTASTAFSGVNTNSADNIAGASSSSVDNSTADDTTSAASSSVDSSSADDKAGVSSSSYGGNAEANKANSVNSGVGNDSASLSDRTAAGIAASGTSDTSAASTDDIESGYQNKSNDFKVKFSNTTKNNMVMIQSGSYHLAWGIDTQDASANRNDAIKIDPAADTIAANSSANSITAYNNKFINLKNISSDCEYPNIYSGVDFKYSLNSKSLKENIVLNNSSGKTQYSFTYSIGQMDMRYASDGSIEIFDPKNPQTAIFDIPKAVMYDEAGNQNDAVDLSFEKVNGKYIVTINADPSWITGPDRAFPVTIDPTITTPLSKDHIHETYVASGTPDTNYTSADSLLIGKDSSYGTCRTYLTFEYPALDKSATITGAALQLYQYDSSPTNISNYEIQAHEVNAPFDTSSIIWNSRPTYGAADIDYSLMDGNDGYRTWDITKIAKDWYHTGSNTGVALIAGDESASTRVSFYSSDYPGLPSYAFPCVYIHYVSNVGLEDYWTFHTQDAGRAGTGYVNDYTGNVVLEENELNESGSVMPLSVSHVFNNFSAVSNSAYSNQAVKYGNGWKLNAIQKISQCGTDLTANGYPYYLTDEDGTQHYFTGTGQPSGTYVDEDGLSLTLTVPATDYNHYFSIKDKSGTVEIFDQVGYLRSIADANANTMEFYYAPIPGVDNYLTSITDGSGRITTFQYDTNHTLTDIIDPAGRDTSYHYDGSGRLTRIQYPDGKSVNYSYDNNNNLSAAMDIDGSQIQYSDYDQFGRVGCFFEKGTDDTAGQAYTAAHPNISTAKFTDNLGRTNTFHFDNLGRTVEITDSTENTEIYKYTDTDADTSSPVNNATKNTTSAESNVQSPIINVLKNHSFEYGTDWSVSSIGSPSGSAAFSTDTAYYGTKSVKVVKTDTANTRLAMSQAINIPANQPYTLSGYIKTSGVSNAGNGGAQLFIIYYDAQGVGHFIDGPAVSGTNDWKRYSFTFTLPDYQTAYALAGINYGSGTAYFDNLQLESGSAQNRYNLLDNQSFESNSSGIPTNWTGANLSASDKITSITHKFTTGSNSFVINGASTAAKTLSQTVPVSGDGTANDSLIVGGWAQADSVPIPQGSGRNFDIKVQINYNDGTKTTAYASFNPADHGWQYTSNVIMSQKKAYSSVTVTLEYINNENTAYFDGFQLYKEEFGQSYTYDASGNVVNIRDRAASNSQFAFSSNNDLVSATDPTGASFTYNYDTKHNPVSAANQTGVNYSFQYDSYGNPTASSVVGRQTAASIQNGQIYYIRSNNSKLYLDVNGNADSDNAPVYQHGFNGGLNQQFKAIDMGGGTFQFVPLNSAIGRALAVQGGSTADNTPIVINTNDGSSGEIWKPVLNSDGSYTLESKCTSYASGIDDQAFKTIAAPLLQHSVNGGMNQEWTFELAGNAQPTASSVTSVTAGQYYYVKSVSSNLYMQAKNDGAASGTGVVQNYFTGKPSQQWMITTNSNGTYKLMSANSTMLLTVPGGQNADSVALDLEAQGAGAAQQYTLTYNGDGSFRILTQVSSNARSLNVKGASTSPGAIIQQYTYNGGTNEQWILYPASGVTSVSSGQQYYLQSQLSGMYLQPAGGSTSASTGLEQNVFTGRTVQRWKIVNTGTNTYKLLNTGGNLAVDVPYAQNSDSVALQTFGDNGTPAQQWNFVRNADGSFSVVSGCSSGSKCMEVKGASTSAGAVVQQYTSNSNSNQKWYLVPVQDANSQLSSSASYTSYGNYPSSLTDSRGNTVSYDYGQGLGDSEYSKGLLRSATDAKGNTTSYTYDPNTDNLLSASAAAGGTNVTNGYSYNNDKLSTVTHNGFNYSFSYDAFGNTQSVKVGSQQLVSNTYDLTGTGNLTGVQYGNGQQVGYTYDAHDRITSRSYNGTDRYGWVYDAEGNIASVTDQANGTTYRYLYDFANRPVETDGSNGHSVSYSYDANSKVNKLVQSLNGTQYATTLFLNGDGLLSQLSEGLGDLFSFSYDSLGRVNTQQFRYHTGGTTNAFTGQYAYLPGASGNTTTLVSQLAYTKTVNGTQSSVRTLGYTYDADGNILTISDGGVQKVKYTYDELNELTREDNVWQNKTITYAYDAGGNLTAKTEYPYTTGSLSGVNPTATHSYQYGDGNWKDKLTSYDGNAITYDAIGNPLTYNGWTYSWEEGRQLSGMSNSTTSDTYKYNADGLRTQKTVNGATTTYYLEGSQIAWQTDGTNTIHYVYDNSGNPVYMLLNGSIYYYERNAQNDIIGLVDSSMNEVVTYSYDTWGKLLSIGGSMASTVGTLNPFRYRGYCYDTETGLYYLQSRYYDPSLGRFINADDTDTLDNSNDNLFDVNLFAYCQNNPVNLQDADGHFAWLLALPVGAVVLVGVAGFSYYYSTPAGQRSWYGFGRAVYYRFKPWQAAWNRAVSTISTAIYYAKNNKTKIPSKLKNGDKIRTPDTNPNDFTKNKDGSYTDKKTKWRFKPDKSGHRGPHWDASPPNGKTGDYYNVGPKGNLL